MLHSTSRPGARSSIGTYLQYLVGVTVIASSALAASFVARRSAPKTTPSPSPSPEPAATPDTPARDDEDAR